MGDKKYSCGFCNDEGWVSDSSGELSSPCPMECKDIEKWEVEMERCKNGYGDMSGHEYFYYNYFTINGVRPLRGSYKDMDFGRYKDAIKKSRDLLIRLKIE